MSKKKTTRYLDNNPKPDGIKVDREDLNYLLNDIGFEQPGFIEKDDENEIVRQRDIVENVDLFSAQKYFELDLNKFGPYRINYTRNGRHLLVGGARGHVAAFDWQTKKLHCEINVMETINDIKWLHIETMYAVAQRQWTYIYDNQGIELHCLKVLDRVTRLEFLPYHFLLASINATGYLSYIDVSMGKKVAGFSTALGRCDMMCQNPTNAIIHLGHSSGCVTLWSPNVKEPLVKMLCHKSPLKSLAINSTGNYMITSGLDHLLNVWDMRTYKQLKSIRLKAGAACLAFSQKNYIAAGLKNDIVIFNDDIVRTTNGRRQNDDDEYIEDMKKSDVYLSHQLNNVGIQNLQFCPYEDVLGVGHANGVSSLLVPGAGEACFDAMEANPYESKNQRRQWEVKALLEKIQPELISLDPFKLKTIDKKTLQEKMIERNKKLFLKPRKIDFQPKNKMKGKSKTGKREARKQAVRNAALREFVKEVKQYEQSSATAAEDEESHDDNDDDDDDDDEMDSVQSEDEQQDDEKQKNFKTQSATQKPYNIFDRFKKTKK